MKPLEALYSHDISNSWLQSSLKIANHTKKRTFIKSSVGTVDQSTLGNFCSDSLWALSIGDSTHIPCTFAGLSWCSYQQAPSQPHPTPGAITENRESPSCGAWRYTPAGVLGGADPGPVRQGGSIPLPPLQLQPLQSLGAGGQTVKRGELPSPTPHLNLLTGSAQKLSFAMTGAEVGSRAGERGSSAASWGAAETPCLLARAGLGRLEPSSPNTCWVHWCSNLWRFV